jgi:hypothetical protein
MRNLRPRLSLSESRSREKDKKKEWKQPAHSVIYACHSERRKIIRKADDLAKSRNLLFAYATRGLKVSTPTSP